MYKQRVQRCDTWAGKYHLKTGSRRSRRIRGNDSGALPIGQGRVCAPTEAHQLFLDKFYKYIYFNYFSVRTSNRAEEVYVLSFILSDEQMSREPGAQSHSIFAFGNWAAKKKAGPPVN